MAKSIIRLSIIISLLISFSSCSFGPVEYGILEGQVNIGPLQPAVQAGEEAPTPAPEVYSAREIVVYKKNGVTEFTRLEIGPTGWYQGELPVGTYVIDINRIGIDSADNLPIKIEIRGDVTTRLDVEIDTGIR
ncbi:MAG: hypothetical protein J7L35_10375 [Anaerolineales bacterium]|nr:hypothetical protein [Anaerolineales bacterium]